MKEIEQNPFRILGLPIVASAREIEKQINTLETYAEMGKTQSFETDFSFLSSVERTPEVIADAKKKIQLDESKFFQSLFWFWKNSSVDELAFDLFEDGKVDKAKEIWEKAVFAKRKKTYRSELVIANLISESTSWSEADNDDHVLVKDGEEYTIERKTSANSSIPVVSANFGTEEKNWSIECDAEWMGGNDDGGFGIIFGRDGSNYFTFEISGDGFYRFGKTIDWSYEGLHPWTESDSIRGMESNHLQIMNLDGELGFYINGQIVCSHASEPFFGTNFGFSVDGEQTVTFRNFKFSNMAESEPSNYADGIVVTKKNFSCVKNLSLLYWSHSVSGGTLKQPAMEKAVALANRFFLDEQIEDYSKLVAGDRYSFDRKKTLDFYLTTLVDSLKATLDKTYGVTSSTFIKAFSEFPNGTGNLVKQKFVGKTIQELNKFIEKAQNGRRVSPGDALTVGKKLIENAGKHIDHLNDVLGDDDFEYQVMADRIADEVVQCGIDYFNTTKNDEPCLPLYQYGMDIAATRQAEQRAIENFDSCIQWIKHKVYLFCYFCGKNEPHKESQVTKTMYLETYRSYFPRRVEFSYGDVAIPRCSDCKLLHEQLNTYTTKYTGTIIVCAVVGFVAGFATSPDAYKLGIGLLLGVIGLIGGWAAAKRLITPVDSDGIKAIGEASQYPTVKERIAEGWTFSKPSA